MLPLHRYPLCLLLTSCLLAYGCSTAREFGKTLGDLVNVRAELIKKFGEKDVNLRVNTFENRTNILVTYVNSPLNQQSSQDRAKRAQETAEMVKLHYPSIKNVNQIVVGFMRATTRLVIFHWSETIEIYGFDSEARALRDPRIAPADSSQPSVRYSASQMKPRSQAVASSSKAQPKTACFLLHISR